MQPGGPFIAQNAQIRLRLILFHTRQRGPNMTYTILRIPAAKSQSGYSRSTIYLRIAQGLWTKPVSLGPRAVGWPSNEIDALNAARISGKTDTQIRELVQSLHTKRKDLMAAWGL